MINYRRPYPNELYHYGIKGQKYGVRRFQNKDGSLTPAGKERYYKKTDNKIPTADAMNAFMEGDMRRKRQANSIEFNKRVQQMNAARDADMKRTMGPALYAVSKDLDKMTPEEALQKSPELIGKVIPALCDKIIETANKNKTLLKDITKALIRAGKEAAKRFSKGLR